jgi:hypothetical protein
MATPPPPRRRRAAARLIPACRAPLALPPVRLRDGGSAGARVSQGLLRCAPFGAKSKLPPFLTATALPQWGSAQALGGGALT